MKTLHNQIRYSICHQTESFIARIRISIDYVWEAFSPSKAVTVQLDGPKLARGVKAELHLCPRALPVCMHSVLACHNHVLRPQKHQRRYGIDTVCTTGMFVRMHVCTAPLNFHQITDPTVHPPLAQMLQGQCDIFHHNMFTC